MLAAFLFLLYLSSGYLDTDWLHPQSWSVGRLLPPDSCPACPLIVSVLSATGYRFPVFYPYSLSATPMSCLLPPLLPLCLLSRLHLIVPVLSAISVLPAFTLSPVLSAPSVPVLSATPVSCVLSYLHHMSHVLLHPLLPSYLLPPVSCLACYPVLSHISYLSVSCPACIS